MKHFLIVLAFISLVPMIAHAGNPENGEKLFMKKCKGCHRLTEGTKVGPSLAGVTERRSYEWLNNWIKNPKGMLEAGDPIAVELLKKYKKRMPKLKLMQDQQNRDDVISFLKKYSAN